ncbi:hypothetical protein OIU79_010169 [Salix purpurea]|uniref:Late embryogenesis abundant protein LEA-2 subgroup domain-containing protein n=1 Tax=Salix purpurea TaxID=77065 RepID=A0A9Q0QEZ3_SALPP|nr:hypothetical protein OIU79_010169 [Salix purpurea]
MSKPHRPPSGRTNLASCIVATIFLIFLVIIILIVFFTVFKPKDPKISVNSVQLPSFSVSNNSVNFTFSQYVSVKNPNRAVFLTLIVPFSFFTRVLKSGSCSSLPVKLMRVGPSTWLLPLLSSLSLYLLRRMRWLMWDLRSMTVGLAVVDKPVLIMGIGWDLRWR